MMGTKQERNPKKTVISYGYDPKASHSQDTLGHHPHSPNGLSPSASPLASEYCSGEGELGTPGAGAAGVQCGWHARARQDGTSSGLVPARVPGVQTARAPRSLTRYRQASVFFLSGLAGLLSPPTSFLEGLPRDSPGLPTKDVEGLTQPSAGFPEAPC